MAGAHMGSMGSAGLPDAGPGVGGQAVLQDFHHGTKGPLLPVSLQLSLPSPSAIEDRWQEAQLRAAPVVCGSMA